MVVKIMRWRPWPPLISKKYEVKLAVNRLECGDWAPEDNGALAVEIRWKGPKISLGSFRRTVKRNCTREEAVKRADDDDAPNDAVSVVEWDEEFQSVCCLSGYKDNVFHPWEINFTVLHGQSQGAKNKISVMGTLNLAEYASKNEEQVTEVNVPLSIANVSAVERHPMLRVSLSLLELIPAQDPSKVVQNSIVPLPSPPTSGEQQALSPEKDEVSALKASLRKVKIFTEYVSARRAKKACLEEEDGSEGRRSAKSDGEYGYPFDSDSLDEFEEGESDEIKEESSARKSCSYGTLAFANYAGVSFYSGATVNNEDEDWVYYSNRRRSDAGCSNVEDVRSGVPEEPLVQINSKRSILPWRKRKLSFRSPKGKGEPLLKKAYGEEGGDDIDFDRRQLSSDECGSFELRKTDEDSLVTCPSLSEFGDDCFAVGTWDLKDIISRDGYLNIQTHVFFASIDQRSEQAAGESACTALVAVIADWLQKNRDLMPIKSQFDSLIRDGSLEWRNLCENETYRERFPDRHFDLETVLQAKIRDICVVPGNSFVGFFHPEGMEEGNFDFLHGAMSFDGIWDEITSIESSGCAPVFIVSWNDHFFVLKVERDAYYIIDTLGERLHEGCDQAYILKFDRDTVIRRLPGGGQSSEEKKPSAEEVEIEQPMKEEEAEVCRGKECCKEYIKSFLAAIPIRELQADIKKGLKVSAPLHHRLQIEFHFTQQPSVEEVLAKTPTDAVDDVTMAKTPPDAVDVTMGASEVDGPED